jgi:uncharacterized protein YbjT (DUF2867 family)
MTQSRKTIVICGATGKQGGAVLEALAASDGDWKLIALSRDTGSDKARALSEQGVELRTADLQDAASLIKAFEGAYGVYGVTTPLTPGGKIDTGMEFEQGKNIVDACLANNIRHLVLSTVLYVQEGVERSLQYISKKIELEKLIERRNLPCTVLRPGSFMDEIGGEYLPVKKGVLTGQADGDALLPYIAARDIGKAAARAFSEPESYYGKKFNLVGDFISGDALAEVLSRVTGIAHRHKAPPMLLMYLFAREWIPLRRHFEKWGRPPHPEALLSALRETRELVPDALTFERYLRSVSWSASN